MTEISKILSRRFSLNPILLIENIFKNKILYIILFLLPFCLVNSILYYSAALGQTENSSQPNEEYWQIDFLNAWETVNGNHQYGLFINLSHEWKTYWKNPGDSGFTPEFQISRSENLAKIELIWPTPDIFLENDSQIYGFKKKLVLPILIYPKLIDVPTHFELKVNLGFCKDICIPKTFYFKSKTTQNTTNEQDSEILESLRKVPINLPSLKKYISCTIVKDGKKLALVSRLNTEFFKGDKSVKDMIFQYKGSDIWFTDKVSKLGEKADVFKTTINQINNQSMLIDRSKIELILLTKEGGFTFNGCINSMI